MAAVLQMSGTWCALAPVAQNWCWSELEAGCGAGVNGQQSALKCGKNWPFVLAPWESPGHRLLRCGEILPATVLVGFFGSERGWAPRPTSQHPIHLPPLPHRFISALEQVF